MDGLTISVEMMDITDLGATENQAAGITVMSDSAKNVIKKVSQKTYFCLISKGLSFIEICVFKKKKI